MNKKKNGNALRDFWETCIKGMIIVVFGLYLTRFNVGIGRYETNILLGITAYLFLALSGLLMVKYLQNSDEKISLHAFIMSIIMYAIGFTVTLINMAVFNLDILILIPLIVIGGLWIGLSLFASKKDKSEIVIKILMCLSFSLGLIYGASLNLVIFPIYVLFFFFTFFFLQLSREYIKEARDLEDIVKEKKHRIKNLRKRIFSKKDKAPTKDKIKKNLKKRSVNIRLTNAQSKDLLKKSMFSQIIAIALAGGIYVTLLLTVLFKGIAYPRAFLFIMIIIYIPLVGLACLLTRRSISNNKIPKKAGLLVSFGMLTMLMAILLSV
ncbi:MAG: hypothetical protein EU529_13480 [Promethearchaeota archaeon]|nr:MAG: hypothetical protein EU529_13480 [Candidatus Lokiarchaeota archaeon]